MQSQAKVSLSDFELQLVTDATIILTKNQILKKVSTLFEQLLEAYKQEALILKLPSIVLQQSAKISRGENYKGLPYVMLDYPRCFSKEDVFAIRTFFWWGNFFSLTLHLKGIYKQQYEQKIFKAIQQNELNNSWININSEEWDHHLDTSYTLIRNSFHSETFQDNSILKLVSVIELKEWENADEFLQVHFKKYFQLLFN